MSTKNHKFFSHETSVRFTRQLILSSICSRPSRCEIVRFVYIFTVEVDKPKIISLFLAGSVELIQIKQVSLLGSVRMDEKNYGQGLLLMIHITINMFDLKKLQWYLKRTVLV